MFKICLFKLLVLIISINNIICVETVDNNVVFKNVERSIDLSSQLVKIISNVTMENTGSEGFKNVLWVLDHGTTGKLSYISTRDSTRRELLLKETHITGHTDEKVYSINLNNVEQKKLTLTIKEVYTGSQIAYPAAITQKEKQFVRYFGNSYLYSPYVVQQQTTKVHVRTENIESYPKLTPYFLTSGVITYGPYENIQPFTEDKMTIHFENNSPFLTVTNLKRDIEVSHWGHIAIEETISLLHTGATLKGSLSRWDYRLDNNSLNSIVSFKTILPPSAERLYYQDVIGNISTSYMHMKEDFVELDLRPRFPLYGGWKTCYTLGYSVPSYQYLFHNGDNYIFKFRLIDHVYDNMQVDKLETMITLPVGATNIELKTPFDVTRLSKSVAHTYLDTIGRPVVRFSKLNLVENHIQDLELSYQWSRVLMIHKPMLLSVCLYAIFLLIIVYIRLDFSIYSNNDACNKNQ